MPVRPIAGSVIIANHTSLSDPAIVLAALHRLGTEPIVLTAAGLWHVPLLGRVLTREGHIPVTGTTPRAAQALHEAQAALTAGRSVLLYPEGGLPHRKGVREAPPRPFPPACSISRTPPAPRSYPWARPEPAHWHPAAPSNRWRGCSPLRCAAHGFTYTSVDRCAWTANRPRPRHSP